MDLWKETCMLSHTCEASFILKANCNLLRLSDAFTVVSYPWNSVTAHLARTVQCIQAPFMSLLTTNIGKRETRERAKDEAKQYAIRC